jgi:Plasma-membrane choline transporter
LIADRLADKVLAVVCLGISLSCGVVGLAAGTAFDDLLDDFGFEHAHAPTFLIGVTVGFFFSSIQMAIVSSAINTVIVCYAEAPEEFQMNHPELSQHMRNAWAESWPDIWI